VECRQREWAGDNSMRIYISSMSSSYSRSKTYIVRFEPLAWYVFAGSREALSSCEPFLFEGDPIMTPRSIRRAQERKTRKEQERKAKNIAAKNEELFTEEPLRDERSHLPAISEARLQANRANAQLSSGPKSPEGKATASLNAVKTGLTGRTVLLPSDDAPEYERHIHAYEADYSPVGPRESDLVQSMADTWWRLKRIPCLESALFAQGYIEFAGSFDEHDASVRPSLIQAQTFIKYEKQLRNLQLQEARLFRRYEKDRAELRQLQQERSQREAEALENAATRYQAARQANQPFDPAELGFEFSTAQIEQQLQHMQAREARMAALKAAHYPTVSRAKAHAQAA
jgi:hypothetical protein